jgi:hypothetical protein
MEGTSTSFGICDFEACKTFNNGLLNGYNNMEKWRRSGKKKK